MRSENELKGLMARVGQDVKSVMSDASLSVAEKGLRLEQIKKDSDDLGSELKTLSTARALMSGANSLEGEAPAPAAPRSIGEAITAADAYRVAKSATDPMGRSTFHAGFELGTKAQGAAGLMGEAASGTTAPTAATGLFLGGTAGTTVLPNFLPGILPTLFYPTTIMDLIPQGSTESPVISWVQETSWTNNAAPVPEGASKPYSSNTVGRLQEQVGKIAHLLKITDEMMQDASQFASFVQQRLVQGISRQEEVQVLAGTGYPGVNGLLNHSAAFTAAAGFTPVTATNVAFPTANTPGAGTAPATIGTLTYTRSIGTASTAQSGVAVADGLFGAITDLRTTAFIEPDAIVMNPADWAVIRLSKDGQGQYLGGSFFGVDYGQRQAAPSETLWGVRVVVTPAIPKGTVLIGNFNLSAQVFRRQGITVDMSNQNATDFEQNLVTVRAESRLGLATFRPAGFQLIQLLHN